MASEIYSWINTYSGTFQGIAALIAILLVFLSGVKFVPRLFRYFFPKKNTPTFHNFESSKQGARGFVRYLFRNSGNLFLGREKEFNILLAFLNGKNTFQWWIICGEGGIGKSRLALELCKKMNNMSWKAGFCNLQQIPISFWNSWYPTDNTLLIFDYAAQNLDRASNSDIPHKSQFNIHCILKNISENSQNFKYKVRVILLERQYYEKNITKITLEKENLYSQKNQYEYDDNTEVHLLGWYKKLISPATDNLRVSSTFYGDDFKPLYLKHLSDESLQKIADEIYRKESSEADFSSVGKLPSQFIDILESVDKLKRPLFAIMLAYAMAKRKNSSISAISNSEVLRHTLEREFSLCAFPEKESVQCILSIALSTLIGVLPEKYAISALRSLCENISCTNSKHLISNGFATKNKANEIVYLPLEPDIIGEFFILEGTILRFDEELMTQLINEAWKVRSIYLCYFFDRCLNDFPTHHRLNKFILSLGKNIPNEDVAMWLMLANNLIISNVENSRHDDAIEVYSNISEYINDYRYAGYIFAAGYNLVLGIANKYSDTAFKIFNSLASIECDSSMKETRARVGSIVILSCCEEKNIDRAISVFHTMMKDRNSCLSNEHIARAAFNISALVGSHYEGTDYAYNALPNIFESVLQLHSPEGDYLDYIIKMGSNIISFMEQTDKIDISKKTFDSLWDIRGDGQHDRLIIITAYNLSNHYVKLRNYTEAYGVFIKTSVLSNDLDVARERARILYNLIAETDPSSSESIKISFQSIQRIDDLIAGGVDIDMWRDAAVNFVGCLSEVTPTKEIHAVVKAIYDKAASYFEHDSTHFSKFLANYILFLCVSGDALYNIQDTKHIFSLFPENDEEQLAIKAQCASDILLCMTNDNFFIDDNTYFFACELYKMSEASRNSHDETLCTHPKTMLNMISIKCKKGLHDEAVSLYDEMLHDYYDKILCIDRVTNACTNIIGHCATKRLDLCEYIFDSLVMFSENCNYDDILSTASLNMIVAYAYNDDIENALRIFSSMPSPYLSQSKKVKGNKFKSGLTLSIYFYNKKEIEKSICILLECEKLIQSTKDRQEYDNVMNIVGSANSGDIDIIVD